MLLSDFRFVVEVAAHNPAAYKRIFNFCFWPGGGGGRGNAIPPLSPTPPAHGWPPAPGSPAEPGCAKIFNFYFFLIRRPGNTGRSPCCLCKANKVFFRAIRHDTECPAVNLEQKTRCTTLEIQTGSPGVGETMMRLHTLGGLPRSITNLTANALLPLA